MRSNAVLSDNDVKLDKLEKSIQAALKRKRKIIEDSKLFTYDKLSELYGGMEGQELLDAVTTEHALIQKLTDSGMTYEQIGELADDSSADKYVKQMSFSESNHSYSEYYIFRQLNDYSRTVRNTVLRAQIRDKKFGRNTYGQTSAVRAIMLLCRSNALQHQLCV